MKVVLIMTVLAGSFLASCGGKDKPAKNTNVKVEAVRAGDLKIAFYYSDSLLKGFDYYRIQDSIFTKKQLAFQSDLEGRARSFEDYMMRNQEKAQKQLLSGAEYAAFEAEAPRRKQALEQYQQTKGAQLQQESEGLLTKMSALMKEAGKKFSADNKIDILMIYGEGGQMNFINEKMDVTKEFVNYLNNYQAEIEKDLKPTK